MESTITIRIDETEKEALMKLAEEMGVPFSQLVREAIKQYIKNKSSNDDGFIIQKF